MKPWDRLQKRQFAEGQFCTTQEAAIIQLTDVSRKSCRLAIGLQGDDQFFGKGDLTEFIEFLIELRDSLDG